MEGKRKAILIVEDDRTMAKVLQFNFEKAGFETTVAFSGEEACTKTAEKTFDVVVTDQRMAAMTGIEFCRRLRRDGKHAGVPIILLTGKHLDQAAANQLDELRIAAMMTKPFSPRKLIETAQGLIHEQSGTANCDDTLPAKSS